MKKTRAQIVADIDTHMLKSGHKNREWYVGITADISKRLHGDHCVPRANHWFIWREAYSVEDARLIEKAYLDVGCQGGPGGGDDKSVFVYAYVITSNTNESA